MKTLYKVDRPNVDGHGYAGLESANVVLPNLIDAENLADAHNEIWSEYNKHAELIKKGTHGVWSSISEFKEYFDTEYEYIPDGPAKIWQHEFEPTNENIVALINDEVQWSESIWTKRKN